MVLGGGDTGNDCVGTAMRLGAVSVLQIEMMPRLPLKRTEDNPWPEWPKVLKTDYGVEEAAAAPVKSTGFSWGIRRCRSK